MANASGEARWRHDVLKCESASLGCDSLFAGLPPAALRFRRLRKRGDQAAIGAAGPQRHSTYRTSSCAECGFVDPTDPASTLSSRPQRGFRGHIPGKAKRRSAIGHASRMLLPFGFDAFGSHRVLQPPGFMTPHNVPNPRQFRAKRGMTVTPCPEQRRGSRRNGPESDRTGKSFRNVETTHMSACLTFPDGIAGSPKITRSSRIGFSVSSLVHFEEDD